MFAEQLTRTFEVLVSSLNVPGENHEDHGDLNNSALAGAERSEGG